MCLYCDFAFGSDDTMFSVMRRRGYDCETTWTACVYKRKHIIPDFNPELFNVRVRYRRVTQSPFILRDRQAQQQPHTE
jgi:hypothetical protein